MSQTLVIILLINFIYIGILPRIFFKKDGRYNLMWFLTASPIFFNSIVIFLQHLGYLNLETFLASSLYTDILVVTLNAISIGMISYTMGTHRVPLALWHQTNDAPVHIVTWGAYKYIRHPFYTSFILAETASVIALPNLVTVGGLIACILILNSTAAREEGRLSTSAFGEEYKSYITKTGRFIPKIGA
jgi:protein-S-isoprenylcysteine O-methyltransferase Ste14